MQRFCDQASGRLVWGVDLKRGKGKSGRTGSFLVCLCISTLSLKLESLRAVVRLEDTQQTVSQTISSLLPSVFLTFLQLLHKDKTCGFTMGVWLQSSILLKRGK